MRKLPMLPSLFGNLLYIKFDPCSVHHKSDHESHHDFDTDVSEKNVKGQSLPELKLHAPSGTEVSQWLLIH